MGSGGGRAREASEREQGLSFCGRARARALVALRPDDVGRPGAGVARLDLLGEARLQPPGHLRVVALASLATGGVGAAVGVHPLLQPARDLGVRQLAAAAAALRARPVRRLLLLLRVAELDAAVALPAEAAAQLASGVGARLAHDLDVVEHEVELPRERSAAAELAVLLLVALVAAQVDHHVLIPTSRASAARAGAARAGRAGAARAAARHAARPGRARRGSRRLVLAVRCQVNGHGAFASSGATVAHGLELGALGGLLVVAVVEHDDVGHLVGRRARALCAREGAERSCWWQLQAKSQSRDRSAPLPAHRRFPAPILTSSGACARWLWTVRPAL